jgi:chemotaxis methyl-accepting protein methylase/serine phosphatase RsbU (regulator of sigma subunit)
MGARDEEHAAWPVESDPVRVERVLAALRRVSGSDFSDFRETTLERRVARRMGLLGVEGRDEYLDLLERDDAEATSLFHDVLINVTGFFREPEAFEILQRVAFPEIIAQTGTDEIRLWVPGCSTGEEPYSLAIALSECLEAAGVERHVQVFATDINDEQIAIARGATYGSETVSSVSPERLERRFVHTQTGWRVRKHIREMCVFARHDLTRDPPFTRIDLLSCRNLLIYWNRNLQDKVIPLFHYALKPDGFLLLGSAESATRFPEMFDAVDNSAKLYRRSGTVSGLRPPIGVFQADRLVVPAAAHSRELPVEDVIAEAGRMVAREAPVAAVLVDERLGSLYFWGQTGPVFSPTAGESSLSLSRFLAPELLADTLSAAEEVRSRGLSAWRGPVTLRSGEAVFLHVTPVCTAAKSTDLLVLIDEHRQADSSADTALAAGMTRELEAVREELAGNVEELAAANEDLRASDDQLREANRELIDINQEQVARNAQLQVVNDDLANVLSSTNIPLVVLDGERRIRIFTPPAETLLGVHPADVGRLLTDLVIAQTLPDLQPLIAEVSFDLQERGLQFNDETGRAHMLRVSPYVSEGHAGQGVVLTSFDVEPARRKALEESSRLMSALIAINATMNSVVDTDEVMRSVMVEAASAIGADSVVLYRCDESTWVAEYAAGIQEDIVGTVFANEEFPYLTPTRRREPWAVRDMDADARFEMSPLRRHGSRSIVAIQLVARDKVVGALVFGFRRKTRFNEAKLDFVRKLGTAVSVALENARLYGAQFRVAERLQEALLELPEHVAGIEFAAHYRAAAEEAHVGGDFYDVFEMGGDLVAVVIGDVMGKGLDAASLTALARNAFRAHAMEDCDPAEVFVKANRLVHRFTSVGTFLTAFFGILDTKTGGLAYCSAGHPPAIVVRPKGAEFLQSNDPILGAFETTSYTARKATVGIKDSLLLYTDGIIEARAGNELYGEGRLLNTASGVSRAKPGPLLATLMDDVLSFAGGRLRDDVALLAVRRSKRPAE